MSTVISPIATLSPDEVATLLGVTTRTLARWRVAGNGPTYATIGASIRYPVPSLVDWLTATIDIRPIVATLTAGPGLLGQHDNIQHQGELAA